MNKKHTPGPWGLTPLCIKGKIKGWGINGINDSGDTLTSGRIVDVMFVPNHDDLTQEANARLIASAPNLLEALSQMLEAFAPYAQITVDLEGEQALHSAVKAARAALSKIKQCTS